MDVESHLERWSAAGVLDQPTADRIRAWEAAQTRPSEGLRWPTIVALVFGAILLGAGVLLFVSAHWDQLSPNERFSLVLLLVALFHGAGASVATRFEALSVTLHTVGTFALGAGIALTGQIFHLSEHWPGAILLWALGATAAWAILRHWTQAALTAVLIPAWLCAEWHYRMELDHVLFEVPIAAGLSALASTYLTAIRSRSDTPLRKALAWTGGITLIPSAAFLAATTWSIIPSWQEQFIAWTVAFGGPLLLAVLLRGRDAIRNLAACAWVALLVLGNATRAHQAIAYAWCAAGAIALVAWGVREQRAERINLGIASFAITVLTYYFSDLMDKLDRSLSLILLGFIFLGGGWLLERTRRRLVASIR